MGYAQMGYSGAVWPNSSEKVKNIWKNHTYSISDLVKNVAFGPLLVECKPNTTNNTMRYQCENNEIEIKPVHTIYTGMCYSLKVIKNTTENDLFVITFKSQLKEVLIIINYITHFIQNLFLNYIRHLFIYDGFI